MKKITLTLFIILYSIYGHSQTVTIIDRSNLQPIKNAVLTSGNKSATTNVFGQTDITEFKGEDKIEISSVDYIFQTLSYDRIASMNFIISLTDRSYRTNEIIISANKFDENSRNLPRQVDVLNSQDIKFENTQNTADLLGTTGNILVQAGCKHLSHHPELRPIYFRRDLPRLQKYCCCLRRHCHDLPGV